jgi:hypothetical protein
MEHKYLYITGGESSIVIALNTIADYAKRSEGRGKIYLKTSGLCEEKYHFSICQGM